MVTVGDAQAWLPELIERAKGLKVGNGFDPSTEMFVSPLLFTPSSLTCVDDNQRTVNHSNGERASRAIDRFVRYRGR